MIHIIERFSTRPGMAFLLISYVIVFGMILISLAQLSEVTNGYGILDFDIGYSLDRVNEVFGSYGPEGMALCDAIAWRDWGLCRKHHLVSPFTFFSRFVRKFSRFE